MITLWIIGLALHPENSKKDQNLHFLPLSETNSITVTVTWESSPELFSVPFASHNVVQYWVISSVPLHKIIKIKYMPRGL